MPLKGRHVAACRATPVFLSADAKIVKAVAPIEQAARNGARLVVFPAAGGVRVGALVASDNANAFCPYSLAAQGEQIHISTRLAIWPTRPPPTPAPNEESGGETAPSPSSRGLAFEDAAVTRACAAVYCFETMRFGALCAGNLGEDAIAASPALAARALREAPRGATLFLDPTGALVPGFTVDGATGAHQRRDMLQAEGGILYADLDFAACVEARQYDDNSGAYQSTNIPELTVDCTRKDTILFLSVAA
ncbi:hypothetical protein GGS23DRAFT_618714 [Durotheca rogersii]|uniref:uncharacterized protein n=1 Tax=Durotheca rogersii TaxID=419775 RepID=UPI00221F7286|nr:uncharacterized protein GGS23DRAFT_618714 [Durotheca rogersii]KAI5865598.1 hypothetical protein GGS23DRAFT_618714 [Durotheca rogersii]